MLKAFSILIHTHNLPFRHRLLPRLATLFCSPASSESPVVMASQPAAAVQQLVPEGYSVLQEGKARILQAGNDVFYNKAQVTNRDLSILMIKQFIAKRQEEGAQGGKRASKRENKGANATAGGDAEAAAAGAAGPSGGAPTGADAAAADAHAAAAASTSGAAAASDAGSGKAGNAHGSKAAAGKAGVGGGGGGKKDKGIVVLEGLSATGLRALRYALEIDGIQRIDANDLDPVATKSIERNVAFNGPVASSLVRATCSDARMLMMQSPGAYDVIDLDPYGSPSTLLDSALQAVGEGGLMLVTATDMAVLAGNNSEACWTKYGSYPLHRPYCHEQAIRILLGCLEMNAARHKKYIVPLVSLSVDFYVRVFIRVYTSAAESKRSANKLAYVWQSQGCDSFYLQRVGQVVQKGNSVKFMAGSGPAVPEKCPETGAGFLMGGPIWAEPLHDFAWVEAARAALDRDKACYAQYERLKGLLTTVAEELPDAPLYFNHHDICKTLKCTPFKSELLRSAILNAGYRVSGSHANPLAVKTDAPFSIIWDIMRCWVQQHPVRLPESFAYAKRLLEKEPQHQANFSRAKGAISAAKASGVARYVENPANWGPKARAGRPEKNGDAPEGKQQQKGAKRKAEAEAGDQPASKEQATE